MSSLWAAPFRTDPVDATVSLPGSKSQTNRALVLSALAEGPSRLSRPLESRDTLLMADALRALGAAVTADGDVWTVEPLAPGARDAVTIDVGLAGTVMRFVPPVAALVDGPVTFDGDPRARERPMGPRSRACARWASCRRRRPRDDAVHGRRPGHARAGRHDRRLGLQPVPVGAPAGRRTVRRRRRRPSRRTPGAFDAARRDDAHELRRRGVIVDDCVPAAGRSRRDRRRARHGDRARPLQRRRLHRRRAGDGGPVRVHTGRGRPTRPVTAGARSLAAFGATSPSRATTSWSAAPARSPGSTLDLRDEGELTPSSPPLAALADRAARLTGIAHLRGHETDRLAALVDRDHPHGRRGRTSSTTGSSSRPVRCTAPPLHSYEDHRMAHAAAVLGLAVKDTRWRHRDHG